MGRVTICEAYNDGGELVKMPVVDDTDTGERYVTLTADMLPLHTSPLDTTRVARPPMTFIKA
jgi:hypothetical protein